MINWFNKIFSSDLAKGSVILFLMINIFNFLNYVFHFSMIWLLTPADYSVLGVLMFMVYLYSNPSEAVIGTISKYTTKLSSEGEDKKIKYLILSGLKKVINYSLIGFIILCFIGIFVSKVLNINFWLIFITNLFLFGIFITAVLRGVLQGKKRFVFLGSTMVVESIVKLIIAIVLVLFGLRVFGPVIGIFIGFALGIGLAFYALKDIWAMKQEKTNFEGIGRYSLSFLGVMIIIVLMYGLDVVFARLFFAEDIAGKYTILSTFGKMIFFGTLPISRALFPVSSEKFHKNQESKTSFFKSASFILFACSAALLVFLIFPKTLINILANGKGIEFASYLIFLGIGFSFSSLTYLVMMYGLSIERFKKFYYLFIFVLIEVLMFWFFHNSILEFSLAFMFSNILLFLGSIIMIKIKN